jgi:hypothetical protein
MYDPGDDFLPEEDSTPITVPPLSVADVLGTELEDSAEDDLLKNGPENVLHCLTEDRYYLRRTSGDWSDKPITSSALSQRLLSMGLPRNKQDAYKTHIRSFSHREADFTSTECLVKQEGITVFNPYRPPKKLRPVQGDWSLIKRVFMNLVDQDPLACEYVLDWIASPLQSMYKVTPTGDLTTNKGHLKMGTTLVFHGVQGSGKGTLEAIITALYGVDWVANVGQEALDGRFNGELVDKLFVIANEVISSTNRSTQTSNKIKPWITDEWIPVEAKYEGARRVRNTFNIIFTSNDDRPVLVEKSDRRYSIFKNNHKLDEAVADAVHADLRGDQKMLQAFLYHLLVERKPTIKYGQLYKTQAREDMMKASAPSDEKFCEEIRQEGWFSVASQWKESGKKDEVREMVIMGHCILAETLADVYKQWCDKNNLKPRGQNFLGQAIHAFFPGVKTTRAYYGGSRRRLWEGIPMEGIDDGTPVLNPTPTEQKKSTDNPDFT